MRNRISRYRHIIQIVLDQSCVVKINIVFTHLTLFKYDVYMIYYLYYYWFVAHKIMLVFFVACSGMGLLKVGGRMVYSTCSMNPVENEAVVAEVFSFVNLHHSPDIAVLFVFIYFTLLFSCIFMLISLLLNKILFWRHMKLLTEKCFEFFEHGIISLFYPGIVS
jgi:hypothetical protein